MSDDQNFKNLTTSSDIEALTDADAPCEWRLGPVLELERQIAAERERQRGWRLVCASSGRPPEALPPGGELIYGRPGAHVETDSDDGDEVTP